MSHRNSNNRSTQLLEVLWITDPVAGCRNRASPVEVESHPQDEWVPGDVISERWQAMSDFR